MTRQYKWMLKQKALGNCITCGKPRTKNKNYCEEHELKNYSRSYAYKV